MTRTELLRRRRALNRRIRAAVNQRRIAATVDDRAADPDVAPDDPGRAVAG
ncbi:hypothetical protein GCM10010201_09340 [Pilimelia columellifera subsp. columellifera]|uniref:5-formyltetrahydrofolate cyclo-ligase n=2 Tax=Pilimelia TaxID=53370 RepID=A0ABP6AHD6_9ACTN